MADFQQARTIAFITALAVAPLLAAAQGEVVDAAEKKLLGAEGLLARSQYDLAQQEFNDFLKTYPSDARISRARFGDALCAYNLNHSADAVTLLESVITDSAFPRREEALALLGTVYLATNHPDKSLATLDTLLKDYPKGTQIETATVNRAQALYRLNRFADSLAAIHDFLKANPKSSLKASALYVSALDQRGLGDNAAAESILQQVTTDFPNSPFFYEAQLQIGEALAAQEKFPEAIAHYQRLETRVPESRKPALLLGLGMALSQAGRYADAQREFDRLAATYPTSPLVGAAALQKAITQMNSGDRPAARAALVAVAKEFPAQANAAAYYLARCDLLEDKYEAAKSALQKLAARKTAELPDITLDLAYCDLMLGSDDSAVRQLEAFRTAYPYSPHLSEALYYEGTALHRLGDFTHSLQFCDAVIATPHSPVARSATLLKAENLLMLGQYEKADATLATLDKQPASEQERLRILLRRGQAAYFLGDYKTAEDRLAEVARTVAAGKHDPALNESVFLLGDTQLERGEYPAAIASLQSYLQSAPKTRADEAAFKLAKAQLAAKDQAAGMDTLRELMKGDAHSAWAQRAWLEYAQLSYDRNDLGESIRAAQTVLSAQPAEPLAAPANYLLARVEMDQQNFPAAADRLAALAKTYPKNPLAEEATFVRGIALQQAKKPADAQKQFAAYLQTYPAGKFAAEARHQAAVCMTALGQTTDAAKSLVDLAARPATRTDGVLYDLAWTYRAAGDTPKAIDAYNAILKEFPTGSRARAVRVELPELLFTEKHYQQAIDLLTAALADASTDAHLRSVALYRLGHCYARLGDSAKAAATFDTFAKTFPTDPLAPDAISEAGAAYALLDKLDEAQQRQTRVLKDFPNSPAAPLALLRLGEAQNQAAQYDAASKTFAQWLKQYPRHALTPRAQFGLGWAAENLNQNPQAREAYAQVLATDNGPTAARAQFQIGETWFAEKKFDLAAKELLKVDILYAAPEWAARGLYEAGRAFEQTHDTARAQQQYRDCIKKYPTADVAIMAKKRLEALGG